jgi:hypothetical protein
MNKPGRFRAALLAALPSLATDPERLSIYVERGGIRSTGEPGGSWEYVYQLTAIIQDFADDMDTLAAAVLAWVQIEQPDMLKNMDTNARAIRFECEMISTELADVQVEIDLTEAVLPGADPNTFIHPPEPPADPTAMW